MSSSPGQREIAPGMHTGYERLDFKDNLIPRLAGRVGLLASKMTELSPTSLPFITDLDLTRNIAAYETRYVSEIQPIRPGQFSLFIGRGTERIIIPK